MNNNYLNELLKHINSEEFNSDTAKKPKVIKYSSVLKEPNVESLEDTEHKHSVEQKKIELIYAYDEYKKIKEYLLIIISDIEKNVPDEEYEIHNLIKEIKKDFWNVRFPINDNNQRNHYFDLNETTKEAITSNLLLLLLTERGERYYYPEYGTNLLKFIFEPNDDITGKDIEIDIKRTVGLFMPNITIDSMFFSRDDDDQTTKGGHELSVLIKFTYTEDAFSESGVVELTF
jgi:phage baseplate assembly protein W